MTKPKRINMTYTGDGARKKVEGTYTSPSGLVHGVERNNYNSRAYSLCGKASWNEGWAGISHDKSGKVKDITCKNCLVSLGKNL